MPKFIDRDKALSFPLANGKYDHEHANEHFIYGLETYKEWLEQLPTLSPDDVRGVGEWTPVETELGFACSVCGKYLDEYVHGGEWVSLKKTPNYCPSCGARMKGAEDGTTDNS